MVHNIIEKFNCIYKQWIDMSEMFNIDDSTDFFYNLIQCLPCWNQIIFLFQKLIWINTVNTIYNFFRHIFILIIRELFSLRNLKGLSTKKTSTRIRFAPITKNPAARNRCLLKRVRGHWRSKHFSRLTIFLRDSWSVAIVFWYYIFSLISYS